MSESVEARAAALEPDPPEWFRQWIRVREATSRPLAQAGGTLAVARGDGYSGVRADIDSVEEMSDGQLGAAVEAAYTGIRQELACAGRHPIRVWNFVPGIQAPADVVPERYMIFNVGRFHLAHLAPVVRTGCGPRDADPGWTAEWLDRFRSVRVCLPAGRDVSRVAWLIESRFRRARQVEYCEADLCRRELLIEIEGVASLHD